MLAGKIPDACAGCKKIEDAVKVAFPEIDVKCLSNIKECLIISPRKSPRFLIINRF